MRASRWPASLSRARELAELVRAGVVAGRGVLRWNDHLSELLLSRDPALVAELARARLAPLAQVREHAAQTSRGAEAQSAWDRRFDSYASQHPDLAEELRAHRHAAGAKGGRSARASASK